MQPKGLVLRRVALCLMFICSIVAIVFLAGEGSTDIHSDTVDASASQKDALELELEKNVQIEEGRDDKIALFVNYVALSGVSTELRGEEVYVPVRFFCESMLDCRVVYSSKKKTLTVSTDGLSFEAVCGNNYVVANGRYLYVEEGVSLHDDGQIWLPVSILSKIFGYEYSLDIASRSLFLSPTGKFIVSGDKYYNKTDLYWLSRIISAESRGEPLIGQIAVGSVVLNRVDSKKFPNTIYKVIFDGSQFSPAVSGSVYKTPHAKSVIAAKIVLEGYRISDNILFFHSIKTPSKYAGFVNTEYEMVVGRQFFYTVYKK